jgi:putative membrane protein insertion efficiency factor
MTKIATIFCFLLVNSICLRAQTQADFALLQQAFQPASTVKLTERFSLSRNNPNELQAVLSGLFLFYKAFISSQDQNRCNFHPSCSEYGLQAVKKLGIVRGAMCTFDRLTRCNGLSPAQYDFDLKTGLLKDPVQW